MNLKDLNISFKWILVEPAYGSNIGAAARAMKTMGFSELALVNPLANHLNDRARSLAKHAVDILESAQIYPHLKQALADCDFAIATTTRNRKVVKPIHTLRQLPEIIIQQAQDGTKIGVVFGCESSGLKNEDIELCDHLATIPMAQLHPSLNLAQSVMLFCYELSQFNQKQLYVFAGSTWHKQQQEMLDPTQKKQLLKHCQHLLELLDLPEDHPDQKKLQAKIQQLNRRDSYFAFYLVKKILKKLTTEIPDI